MFKIMEDNRSKSFSSNDKFRERFLALQQRRQESCRGSESRRINDIKLSLLANVKQQFRSSDELDELQKCSVDLDALTAEAEAIREWNKRHRRKKPGSELDSTLNAKLPKFDINTSSNTDKSSCDNCTTMGEHSQNDASMDKITCTSLENKLVGPSRSCLLSTTCDDEDVVGKTTTRESCNERLCDTGLLSSSTETFSNVSNSQGTKQCIGATSASTVDAEAEAKWSEIKPYLRVNDHLVRTTGSGQKPRSHLEEQLEKAIETNDVNTAEHLSDRLAEREFGIRIATAIDAKAYLDKQSTEKAAREAAKKKKLAWGFVPKHRWETKGNM